MSENTVDVGVLRRVDGGIEGTLERLIAHPRAEVWRTLTDPERFARWLAGGSIELRQGGSVKIDFADSGTVIDSTVSAFEPERLLAYSWSHSGEPERPLRWELDDASGGTRLTLKVRVPSGEDIAKACAGFEAHLHMFEAVMEGLTIRFPFLIYTQARAAYTEQLSR